MARVQWRDVTRLYGGRAALDSVSAVVENGEILALLGPSGSGKSTLLRLTAGLDRPSSGAILCDGADLATVPPHRRGFGLMFQDYGLFPHLDVAANVAFGLRMQGMPRRARRDRVREMLSLVRLEGFAERGVLSLSGGEQQRVALARSLAPSPRLLMLDEPLAALDTTLRAGLLEELSGILRAVRATALYVTHDHAEALAIADRVVVLQDGRVARQGTPEELVRAPGSPFVAAFLGLGAVIDARGSTSRPGSARRRAAQGARARAAARTAIDTPLGVIPAGDAPGGDDPPAAVLVRPAAVRFSPGPGRVRVRARLLGRRVRPPVTMLRIALLGDDGGSWVVECPDQEGGAARAAGVPLRVWIDPAGCLALRGGRRGG